MLASAVTEKENLLEIDGLAKTFKGLRAVDGYRLRLPAGEILGIIGPNGAGKSTVFNLLTGHIRPSGGTIRFRGRDITRLSPDRIARLGIGRTFQNIRLFPSMTVLENVVSARQLRDRSGLLPTILSLPSFHSTEKRLAREALEELDLFGLADRAEAPATSLPYGDQRRLEIVRALALGPSLLLLDEPTAGMNPSETQALMDFIVHLRDELGITILLIEHQMRVVMGISETVTVLDYGEKIAEGTPAEIQCNPRVIEAYLGRGSANQQVMA